jgi:hypothetical protein
MLKCVALPVYQKKKTTAHAVLSQRMELHAVPSEQKIRMNYHSFILTF